VDIRRTNCHVCFVPEADIMSLPNASVVNVTLLAGQRDPRFQLCGD
jgi:hypothetical protein